jgi:hypothetical protein
MVSIQCLDGVEECGDSSSIHRMYDNQQVTPCDHQSVTLTKKKGEKRRKEKERERKREEIEYTMNKREK